ncbi:alpha/beta fold hydrolase [[Bacillus] enclensis]|uniref:alpha/beta fold hydrolase n=1 Tax=[Bacillus] enclensis TaxID=1402860 RepID=UPI0018DE108C|nr:alpha/beta hydrolase [[Bacillus] enclensis]MBH9964935.1 alpha/beta hydrolase [[Bacillus] enclensis]
MVSSNLEHIVLGNGPTTLVFEIGIGNSIYNWWSFVQRMKNDFTIVMYHRAGYGKSEVSSQPRDVKSIAMELNTLIDHLEINEKFVLAGHSFGGLCAQQYAKMFPEKLKAAVLIDSTSFNFQKLYDLYLPVIYSHISLEKMIESNLISSGKTRKQLEIDFYDAIQEARRNISEEKIEQFVDFITRPDFFKTIAEEFQNWHKDSELLTDAGPFPELPLTVIARDERLSALPFIEYGIPEEEATLHEKAWRELQIELSQMNSMGQLVIAEGSDHEVHKDRPDLLIECLMEYK